MSQKGVEDVSATFNRLRTEQRAMASKLSEIQMDLNEHKLVGETLSTVPGDRRCFRMIGGVLVERTVDQVAPALAANQEKLGKLIETLEKQMSDKGAEINAYMEKHNIQIKGGATNKKEEKEESSSSSKGGGVLVSNPEKKSS